jgi:putative hydrolase of the HAD superfamily
MAAIPQAGTATAGLFGFTGKFGVGSILDEYEVLLLDMNGTFMFGEDRFGPDHDYYATYRELFGTRLTPCTVRQVIDDCYGRMAALYKDPNRINSFPQVQEILAESPACIGLPAAEIELLEAVIARHELGRVPDGYAAALRRLAATHQLGVVTNIWSRKPPWLAELRRAGVLDLFAIVVISSDGPSMKPSPALMRQALAFLSVPPPSVLFVGDCLRCDIGGAAAVGIDSVWVNTSGATQPSNAPAPTFEVRSLLWLVHPEPGLSSHRRR